MAWGNRSSASSDFTRLCNQIETNQTASNSLTILRSKYAAIWKSDDCASKLAKSLANNRTLIELNCLGLDFDEKACAALADSLQTNKTLKKLLIGNETFSDNHIITLLRHGNAGPLTCLDFEKRELTSKGIESIAKAIGSEKSQVETLMFGYNSCSEGDWSILASGLKTSLTLRVLDLKSTNLTSQGAEVIAKALTEGKQHHLDRLDVSFNPSLGSTGLHALASISAKEFLADGCQVGDGDWISVLLGKSRHLVSLSDNNITASGATLLAELAFLSNETNQVMSLRLSKNTSIGNDGVEAIGRVLHTRRQHFPTHPPINAIDISLVGATRLPHEFMTGLVSSIMFVGNSPIDDGHLIEGLLRPEPTLRAISLSGTGIQNIAAVFQALHSHPSLVTVEFGGIPLSASDRDALAQLREANPNLDVAVDKGINEGDDGNGGAAFGG